MASHSGTESVGGMRKKATSGGMLHFLTLFLPPGRTSHYGLASDNDLLVQLYLDAGGGAGMRWVSVGRRPAARTVPARGSIADVTAAHPDVRVVSGPRWAATVDAGGPRLPMVPVFGR